MSSPEIEFIGFDLGHGETALGRAYARSMREPEILDFHGQKSFVTAVAKTKSGIKIGSDAVNLSVMGDKPDVWVKFKGRDVSDPDIKRPTELFANTLISDLQTEKKIQGLKASQFIIGCPSGWSQTEREQYKELFENSGLKQVRVVPESRAALMTALEQGYLSLEAAKSSVLIVDVGSSTTDFTYCQDLDAEDVGHNVLGSGLLDSEIFKLNLARQTDKPKIEKLIRKFPHYKPIMEYWCRLAKEQYFNGQEMPVEIIKRLPIDRGVLFEIRLDKTDADTILNTPLEALNGFTWPDAFNYALKEALEMLGGRAPETVLLTGGASRLPLIRPACEKAFPRAKVILGAEPEFAIARGLAWLGRFEYLHASFKSAVATLMAPKGDIYKKAEAASLNLGERLGPKLIDALSHEVMIPIFRDWRSGRIASLDDIDEVLEMQIRDWLGSEKASQSLRPVIDEWFSELQRDIEQDTDPLCREHGLPAMVLSLDDSQHVSQYLEGMSVDAPRIASLETDTAIAGTTITTLIVGALLAKANLLAPLLANPIGLIIGGVLAGGGYMAGKKALSGRFKSANVPVIARKVLTDGRIRRAIKKQRPELIEAVKEAWDLAATEKFTSELISTLERALAERADDRAVLFLI